MPLMVLPGASQGLVAFEEPSEALGALMDTLVVQKDPWPPWALPLFLTN